MALKSDSQGFLVGELEHVRRELVDAQGASTKVLESISRKVGHIARLLGQPREAAQEPRRSAGATAAASNRTRDASGRFVADAGGRSARTSTPSGKHQEPGSAAQHAQLLARPAPTTAADPVRVVVAQEPKRRDTSGRFTAGDRNPKEPRTPDDGSGGSGLGEKVGKLADAVKSMGNGAEQIDPALAAASEVKQVLEPLGRGAMALFGRNGERNKERKRERWYQRIHKALTGRKEQPVAVTGAGDGGAGLMGSLFGGLGGTLRGLLPMMGTLLLRVFAPIAALWASFELGKFIGGKIYEWLDKSGITTKIFDAFDAVKGWFKDKFTQVNDTAQKVIVAGKQAANDYSKGREEAFNPQKTTDTGKVLDAGGRDVNDPRRLDARVAELAPSTSVAQSVGRGVGNTQRFMQDKMGFSPLDASNNPVLLQKMDKGSRRKQDFTGVSGGADLANYGTYTAAEADRVKLLKSTGQNTSAFGKGGMTPELRAKIAKHAGDAGLDPTMMEKIVAMESGGNANAVSKTGAIGLMQFTGQTATGVGIRDRFDPDQNLAGGMRLTKENMASLKKSGLPVTAENLYMMHQLGPKAASEVITGSQRGLTKDQLSPETQKAMNLNYGAKSATAADYIATNKKALDTRHASVTGEAAPGAPATATVAGARTDRGAQAPAVAVATAGVTAQSSPQVPSSVPTKLPDMPRPQAADVPAEPEKDRPLVATVREPIGQDVGDRAIAHIVTGGLGAAA